MGQRDPGVGRAAGRGGDPGDDLEGDPGGEQRLELLAAAAEDERIAALERHHVPAGAARLDEQRVDAASAGRRGARGSC